MFAIVGEPGEYAVSVMLVRGGRNLGTTSYFPRAALAEPDEALASFVMQYYASTEVPPEVLLGSRLEESAALAEALSERSGHKVGVRHPVRGLALRWVELTQENATQALRMRLMQRQGMDEMLAALAASSTCRRRRSASSASTSATRAARARWPPAWCSVPKGR